MQISSAAVILLQLNSVKYSSLYVYNAAIEKHLHTNFLFTFQIKSKREDMNEFKSPMSQRNVLKVFVIVNGPVGNPESS